MKVFIDEDCGTGIPKSLKLVKMPCEDLVYPQNRLPIRFGTKDPVWIPWAGDNGYLALSMNRRILENPSEFALLVEHRLGIVFVDNGKYPIWQVLKMFMVRWEWFEEINRHNKPFAYTVGLTGRPIEYDLSRGPRRPSALHPPNLQTVALPPLPPRPRLQPPLF